MTRFLSQTAVAALGAAALIAVAAEPEVLTPGTVAVQIAVGLALGAAALMMAALWNAAEIDAWERENAQREGAGVPAGTDGRKSAMKEEREEPKKRRTPAKGQCIRVFDITDTGCLLCTGWRRDCPGFRAEEGQEKAV